ncbi:hypothetical protein CSKR_103541 [Clonorchis sinensis]|uniref:Uncharacterized protein n=1 Tax=Clonorchis sinensis TaxID=79923 RepID=A0A419PTS7_CLOSI|nr:hypothetical protein CSKR_103541 [Clonorchis sinensis]
MIVMNNYKRMFCHEQKRELERLKWLEREFTDRKVRSSNLTSASRLPLSRLGQPGSISVLVLPSGGMTARNRKGVTAERLVSLESLYSRACRSAYEDPSYILYSLPNRKIPGLCVLFADDRNRLLLSIHLRFFRSMLVQSKMM